MTLDQLILHHSLEAQRQRETREACRNSVLMSFDKELAQSAVEDCSAKISFHDEAVDLLTSIRTGEKIS